MKLSILIVNYKYAKLIKHLLSSLFDLLHNSSFSYEVYVIDNNSHDGIEDIIYKKFPEVTFIQTGANLGYGKANNIGIERSKGEYILILNPDTAIIQKDSISKMLTYIENNTNIGILVPKLLYPNKNPLSSVYTFPRWYYPVFLRTPLGNTHLGKKALTEYRLDINSIQNPTSIDWAQGSCFLVRRNIFDINEKVFDERFFMYMEDTDLCRRVWNKKFKVVFFPESEIIHYYGGGNTSFSLVKTIFRKLSRIHIVSWYLYFKKWGIAIPKIQK